MVTGAPKTGKTFVSVALAVTTYRKNLRAYKIKKFINSAVYTITFKKLLIWKNLEEPMLYSNMPLANVRYNKFTLDILLRKKRVPYKSVILLDEVSLIADSMLFKDADINEQLTEFMKLIGHEVHSGTPTLICNTQELADCHYSFRRCCGSYMYLYSKTSILGFSILNGVELVSSDSNQTGVNSVIVGDIQKNCYKMLFSNKWYKYYDCYYLSDLTDSLNKDVNYDARMLNKRVDSLKIQDLVTLQKWNNLDPRKQLKECDFD